MTDKSKTTSQNRRRARTRTKLRARSDRPRLTVFRSNKAISAQIINDQKGHTLVAAGEAEIKSSQGLTKTERATQVGQLLAQKARSKKVTAVLFDRGHYRYHGRIKALAEAARKGGLQF